MSGYMDLFLETGNPAFYMMAKQRSGSVDAASGGATRNVAGGATYDVACGAVNCLTNPTAKEGTSS